MSSQPFEDLDDPKRSAALKLAIIARQFRAHFDQNIAKSRGVTRSQWTVIAAVAGNPGATQRVIAGKLEISEASAGRLIDRLCAEGLVERRRKEDDRRAHAVYLTEAGEAMTTRLSEIAHESENVAFAGVSDAEIEKLNALLDRISDNLTSDG